jgi:hypothetical protein
MEKQSNIRQMRVLIEVVDAATVKTAGASDDPVDLVALVEQEFGRVGAVLACDAGDEGFFHSIPLSGSIFTP